MPSNPRSIASLTISFGLVAIPVKLYSATISSERISFNLLRQKDGSRVKLLSRNLKDATRLYPTVAQEVARLNAERCSSMVRWSP